MPAGGIWQSQNKVRPGAYINVVGVPKPLSSIGERGVVAIVMEPGWGEQITRLTVNEFITGGGLYKIGANYTDDSDVARQLRLAFQGAASVVIRRSNTSQVKAAATIASGTCTATAKYAGTFGNNISLKVALNTVDVPAKASAALDWTYGTITAVAKAAGSSGNGLEVEMQRQSSTEVSCVIKRDSTTLFSTSTAQTIADLTNDYVDFSGTSDSILEIVTECKEATLSGGDTVIPVLNTVTLETYVSGILKVKMTSADKDAFSNEWVDISASVLSSFVAGEYTLSGGTNGSADSITNIFADLEQENWNVLAFPVTDSISKDAAVTFIKSMRDDNGIKVQAVLTECSGTDSNGYTFTSFAPDYEGIYVCKQGYRLSDATIVSPIDEVYMLAGMIAGATITESLTGSIIPNAIEVLHNPKTNDGFIEAINDGKLVLSKRRDGAIVIEYDINSFTSLTAKKGKVFTKGRPMRVLDNICNDVKSLWDNTYLGKVSNNADGRGIFKADIIKYMNDLQKMEAVQNFDPDSDLEVIAGDDSDSVVVNLWVQPVDSMEKLYMTIPVRLK